MDIEGHVLAEFLVLATLKSLTEVGHIHGLAMEQWRFMAQVTKHETRSFALLYGYRSWLNK